MNDNTRIKVNGSIYDRQEISYRKVIQVILSRWKWIACTTSFGLLLGAVILEFTPPTYLTEASLKFEEKRSDISELMTVRNVYDRSDKLLSEQYVIRSREVLLNAIKKLNYPVSFYKAATIRNVELYPEVPISIRNVERITGPVATSFEFKARSARRFTLRYVVGGRNITKNYSVGELISAGHIKFIVDNYRFVNESSPTIIFHFNTPEQLLTRVNEGLKMNENKSTNILTFAQADENPTFAADILNSILDEYVRHDRTQKTISSTQTIKFIDRLQADMMGIVRTSGSNLEKFKVASRILDISGASRKVIEKLETLDKEKSNLKLEAMMVRQLQKDILANNDSDEINNNLQGITDPLLEGLLNQYNNLLARKQHELITYRPGAFSVQEIDKQLRAIKSSFINNVNAQLEKNRKALLFIEHETQEIKESFNAIPKAEKEYVSLHSDVEVNQKVYAYLSEKKLEAQISKAAATPGVQIVDRAQINEVAITPIPKNVYSTALLLGLCSGITLIFCVRVLNPFIYDTESIGLISSVPIIGIIRKYPSKYSPPMSEILKLRDLKSIFSESVRAVRTNISFLAPDERCKVICITSEIAREGKSFTAVNIASTLCLIEKKVIIIAADLRKSRLHHAFGISNLVGLSTFLSGQATGKDIVFSTAVPDLFFIPAGPVPPNPSELLHSARMNSLIAGLKLQFDYIIIDCAPLGLVSDAVPLIKLANINLFIIRAGVSRFTSALIPGRLSTEFGLTNFFIILNAFNNDILHSRLYMDNGSSNHYHYTDYSKLSQKQGYLMEESKHRRWSFLSR
jgi:capsular exopolysaccharide synthesis family protein